MKVLRFCLSFFFFFGQIAYSASFISVGMGNTNFKSDVLTENSENDQSNREGDLLSLHFGYFLTNALCFELGYLESTLETYDLNPTLNWKQEGNLKISTVGFRYFSYEFLNIIMGMSKVAYQPQITSSDALSEYTLGQSNDTAPYYGIGFGLTFKKWQIFYDTRVFELPRSKDLKVYNWGVRVFF